jgi:hypothetical protein
MSNEPEPVALNGQGVVTLPTTGTVAKHDRPNQAAFDRRVWPANRCRLWARVELLRPCRYVHPAGERGRSRPGILCEWLRLAMRAKPYRMPPTDWTAANHGCPTVLSTMRSVRGGKGRRVRH